MSKLSFLWHVVRPDQRQYRQQEIELLAQDIFVDVEIDADKIQLDENGHAHISPETMAEIMQKLESVFVSGSENNKTDDDWGNDFVSDEPKNVKSKSDDDWDDKSVPDSKPQEDDAPWDDENEEWE